MRRYVPVVLAFGFGLGGSAQAQMSHQRYYLESTGFEFVSRDQTAKKRCVQWRDLVDKNPVVQYDGKQPFVMLEIEARIEGTCPLNFSDGQLLESLAGEGAVKIFRFKVLPPSAAFLISGPGFSDQLIFEALVSQPEQVGFFKFFENSKTRFDLGYGTYSTSNNSMAGQPRSARVFPVMSGLITIPFPWYRRIHLGFSLSQNLSNFLPDRDIQFQFAESAFDLRFVIGSATSHQLSVVAEARGRNWYQLGKVNPFVIRSSPGPGFGLDYDSWFGGSKWGYSLTGRYGFRRALDAKSLGETRGGFSVNYKFSNKWAMGLGYKWTRLGVDFSKSTQSGLGKLYEQAHLVNLSLILIPKLEVLSK